MLASGRESMHLLESENVTSLQRREGLSNPFLDKHTKKGQHMVLERKASLVVQGRIRDVRSQVTRKEQTTLFRENGHLWQEFKHM